MVLLSFFIYMLYLSWSSLVDGSPFVDSFQTRYIADCQSVSNGCKPKAILRLFFKRISCRSTVIKKYTQVSLRLELKWGRFFFSLVGTVSRDSKPEPACNRLQNNVSAKVIDWYSFREDDSTIIIIIRHRAPVVVEMYPSLLSWWSWPWPHTKPI